MPALRNIHVVISLEGTLEDDLIRINREMDEFIKKFNPFKNTIPKDLRETAMSMSKVANEAKTIKPEIDDAEKGIKNARKSSMDWWAALKAIAAIGIGAAILGFANKAIEQSNKAENALIGFNTVVKNTLGEAALSTASTGVDKLFQKLGGSVDVATIQASVKNLLGAGFNMSQALDLVEKNAYMASVNRQSHYASIGEAVQVYTEGIKNNNAMLTDSTGISENLSVTLKKKKLSMDDLNNSTKRALVLQTIYDAHTKEAGQYLGAYNKQMEGYQGQVIKANAALTKITQTSGDFIKSALTPFIAMAKPVLDFFADAERGASRTEFALVLLTTVIGVGLVAATWSWVASLNAAAIAKAAAFSEIIAITIGIAAGLTAMYLLFEDIYVFLQYGPAASDTYFGDMLKWLGLTNTDMENLSKGFHEFKRVMGEAWENMKAFADSDAGKFILKLGKWIAIAVTAFAFLPVVIVAAIAVMTTYIIARWGMITDFIATAWNATIDFLLKASIFAGRVILSLLFPVAGLYIFRKEIMATLKFLYDQFKNTDFGKAIIDSFIRMKDAAIQLFRDMIGSVGDRFNTLFDFERIKTIVVDSLNEVIHKINNTMGSIPIISSAWVNIPDIPGRELGGAVQANKMYRVNERQDEFFKPSQSGTVIPLNQMSNYTPASGGKGGNSFNINVTIESAGEGYDAYALVEKIKELLSSPNELAQQRAELGLA